MDRPIPEVLSNGNAGIPAQATLSGAPAVSAPDSSGPGTFAVWAAGEKERPSNHYHSRALVIEDIRSAIAELRTRGYMCDRITHTQKS